MIPSFMDTLSAELILYSYNSIKLFDTLASAKEKRLKKDLIDLFGFNPADYED